MKQEERKSIPIIEFKNVWFRYPTRSEWVLQAFNLRVYPNESIGIVGESGCGKSTIGQLLLRFYDPDEGQIFFKGKDLRSIDLNYLRSCLGFVMQEPSLMSCSIKDNILYGNPVAKNSEIYRSAELSNAIEFIMQNSYQVSL